MAKNAKPVLPQLEIDKHTEALISLINEDKLSALKRYMDKLPKDVRKRTTRTKIADTAPLFVAAQKGNVLIVNYLVDRCYANIEQHGIYETEEDNSKHIVSPLWCAAVSDHLDVIKALVERGADVNSPSDTESTPVRSACYMTNVAIVEFLLKHNANIHKPNVNGGTCLINSVQSLKLCQLLIDQGADVNGRDNSGNLALHYAVREGRLETVKLLLDEGSDYNILNDFGDNALQTAAIRGFLDIVEYILSKTTQTVVDTINAYELIGANFVDEKHDLTGAVAIWKKAMLLRYKDPDTVIAKPDIAKSVVFNNEEEPNTLDDLEQMEFVPDKLYMQALLTRQRILGPHHRDMTFCLMYRGAVYADGRQFQRCVDLWKHALIKRHEKECCECTNHECFFTAQALVKLFWEMNSEVEAETSTEKIKFTDAFEVFEILADQVSSGKFPDSPTERERFPEDYQRLLHLLLHMVHLFTRLDCSKEEKKSYRQATYDLVRLDPRGSNNQSLLHMANDPETALINGEFYSNFPCRAVVDILLTCEADLNSTDNQGNTPLHRSLACLKPEEFSDDGILKCLLVSGAHIDIANDDGVTPLEMMKLQNLPIYPLEYLSLKCLAASVITKHKIPYMSEIPKSLIPFVEWHGAVCQPNRGT